MSGNPNRINHFWQELKRRKVVRVMAMYAATAFIIMEAGDIMLPRLGLPDWTVTFIIILLIIGFPISIILSWIFDITPEGILKTAPVSVNKKENIQTQPPRKLLNINNIIIAVLVIVVGILAYPKIFRKDKFEGIRDTDGRISIAVMPFQNMTDNIAWDIWENGIQNEIITKLSNSKELAVRTFQTMNDILRSTKHTNSASITPFVARDISRKLEANTFIQGSIKESGDIVRINAQLINSKTAEIYKTYQIDGNTEDDFFIIIDSLSKLVKSYLEIEVLRKELDYDLGEFSSTGSPEAYRLYIRGMNVFFAFDFSSAIELFNKALEIDSGFISARIFQIFALGNQGMHEKAMIDLRETYKQIENVSYINQLMLEYLKSYYDKDPHSGIKYIGLLLQDDPQRRTMWFLQGMNYIDINQYEKAAQCFEKALEIDKKWGVLWKWSQLYILSGIAYHELDKYDREKEIYELGLAALPDYPEIIYRQAICAFSRGDTTEAYEHIAKYKSTGEANGWNKDQITIQVGLIYQAVGQNDHSIDIFRDLIARDPQNPWNNWRLASILIENEINVNEGMDFVNRALETEPDNYYFLVTKCSGLYKQGQFEESLEILNKSWEARPLYNHDHYLHIQEVEKALANQNK